MEERNRPERQKTHRTSRRREVDNQQEIQYTQPKPFFRKRLIIQLLTVAAVVLAIAIGVSIFFKVDTVTVTGASKYSALMVADASGIEVGDSLLFFGKAKAAGRIKAELPYVGSVRFEVKLPGTVNIIIQEKTVAYAVEATDGSWWKMTADGVVVEQVKEGETCPTIDGVRLQAPTIGAQATAAEETNQGEVTTDAERLEAAVNILSKMELWKLFSDVTVIDVSDLMGLRLYCGETYRIELGDWEDMEDKIGAVKAVLVREERVESGVLKLYYEDEQWKALWQSWN